MMSPVGKTPIVLPGITNSPFPSIVSGLIPGETAVCSAKTPFTKDVPSAERLATRELPFSASLVKVIVGVRNLRTASLNVGQSGKLGNHQGATSEGLIPIIYLSYQVVVNLPIKVHLLQHLRRVL